MECNRYCWGALFFIVLSSVRYSHQQLIGWVPSFGTVRFVYSRPSHETSNIIKYKDVVMLIVAIIGVWTCLLMMFGSMGENYSLLLPHLVWEIIIIGLFCSVGFGEVTIFYLDGMVVSGLVLSVVLCCFLTLSTYFWNVIYNRYLEIKRKQSTLPDLIEMQ